MAALSATATNDVEDLERVRRGEPDGAEALFGKYSAALLRFADRMLGSRADAEEIIQDVFVKMITRVEQYDGQAPVSSWLFAIAANACRDRLRKTRRAPAVPLDAAPEMSDGAEPVDGVLVAHERRTAVRRALASLSEEQREALVLARYHGLPYAEIARTLRISEGAVKTRIFRAVETLKSRFATGGTHGMP
ncbi:MAG TPA: RNA polymerase sigma factor [Thermoanaerobaculia bacterium]|nr:RNA polymerase sigma factor [Thermoanaerobaculia bacterium]